MYQHFRQLGHSFENVTIQPVEYIAFNNNAAKGFKIKARYMAELKWMKYPQTPYPLGLNDNIYQEGNISKDPGIDIFSIVSIRKRKSRSHGRRRNGNIKRRSRVIISVADLHTIHRQSGKHSMLSRLTSLSIHSLKLIDEEADKIILRTDPLYDTASLIQSYSQHVLHPHIDKATEHTRHFLKIFYLNKGIDFIDLPSIFRDQSVLDSVPKYFRNTENPIICYKYKQSIRNIIFNYNQIVADLDIEANTPKVCDCKHSKFRYIPSGHIITGNFDIIDKRIRHLFRKGPKYRLPSVIDFDACRNQIAHSLEEFSVKWCRREQADTNSLSLWKKRILEIMNTRIMFYDSNPSSLPPKPNISIRTLRTVLRDFHSKFVLVPADKAANNIIIV